MAVRVRIRVERTSRPKTAIETVALANSGFESPVPEILLPVRAAARLGLWPPGRKARAERYDSPATDFSLITLPRSVRVRLAGPTCKAILSNVAISERQTEAILNDRLVDALKLQLIQAGRGIYRVGPRGKLRRSEAPEYW